MKNNFPEIFNDNKKYWVVKEIDQKTKKEVIWHEFEKERREDAFKLEDLTKIPSFEEAMIIDLLRSTRRDL